MSNNSSSNVVLVGAGFGGFLLFRQLAAKLANTNYNLIVIEPRKFFLHQPSTLRMVVSSEGDYEDRSIMNHSTDLSSEKVRFVHAKATSIFDNGSSGGHVILDNQESVNFSVLILATGSRWSGPIAFETEKEQILDTVNSWRAKFKEAQDIVLVGGGAIGFELSGEIKDQWPDKRVTIVHGQTLPLNDAYPERWRKDIVKKYQKRGVQLMMGEYVTNLEPNDGSVVTRSGRSIPADLVVPTFGSRPNTEFIKSLGPDVLTDGGLVKVQPTLQLVDHHRIFAMGDIIDWKEEKQAMKAMAHMPLVASNVLSVLGLKSRGSLKKYTGTWEIIVLTNGRNGGSTYLSMLSGIILGDRFTKLLKSKTLMVDMARRSLGL